MRVTFDRGVVFYRWFCQIKIGSPVLDRRLYTAFKEILFSINENDHYL